jgi:N-acetylneuraminate synthase
MLHNAKEAGATFVKMQKKDVASFYSKEKLSGDYESPYGNTYGEYREIFEFNKAQFDMFDTECKKINMPWFSTVQDELSIDFMKDYNINIFKVASVNSYNKKFLQKFRDNISKEKTIVISVAGKTLAQIEETINFFKDYDMYILHCVAEYPCKNSNLRLGNIPILVKNFKTEKIKIGYSGHEEGIIPSLAAIKLGAEMIERHFAVSRNSFVHHIECSLTKNEFKDLVTISKGQDLDSIIKSLDKKAFESYFGMTGMEKSFLLNSQYGKDYIKDKYTRK